MSRDSSRATSGGESGSGIVGAIFRNLVTLFFVGVSVMCVYNVMGVGGEVEAMAKETACQGQPLPCTARYTRAERTPWVHTFKMYTSANSGEKDIDCRREYILVGAYSCKVVGGASVDVSPPAELSVKPVSSIQVRFPAKVKPTPVPKPATSAGETP
ncbi:MAG TPA: hypothetical protein PK156_46470 [Polyangium sp.]|nr:hypothetical protein [Polyangium sp.]